MIQIRGIRLTKNKIIFGIILCLILNLSAGCQGKKTNIATIRINHDSNYIDTFENLSMGNIFDFEFTLPEAENKWVTLWVERYIDGVKDTEPLISLNYGESLNEVEEGHLGFGLADIDSDESLAILYAPGVSTRSVIEHESKEGVFSSWDYTVDEDPIELEISVAKVLAIYREVEGDSIHTLYVDDEQAVEEAIEQSDLVYVLKIMIDE